MTSSDIKIIKSIEALQLEENQLIKELDKLTSVSGFTVNEKILGLVDKINTISASRIALFETLSKGANTLTDSVSKSRTDLVGQMTILNLAEEQLNQAKSQMNKLQNRNDTKMRMVQINTYYGQKYEAQSSLMKLIILICIPVLILLYLKKQEILPETITNYAVGITLAVGAFFIIRKVWDITNRNNMNFDEYDWDYEDPSDYAPSLWQYNKTHFFNFDNPIKALLNNLGFCVGSDCCANGLYFDEAKQKCTNREHFGTGANKLIGTPLYQMETEPGITPFGPIDEFAKVE